MCSGYCLNDLVCTYMLEKYKYIFTQKVNEIEFLHHFELNGKTSSLCWVSRMIRHMRKNDNMSKVKITTLERIKLSCCAISPVYVVTDSMQNMS